MPDDAPNEETTDSESGKTTRKRRSASKPAASEVSVRAQALAEEHGIDLSKVSGSGDKGRVRLADVEKHVSTQTDE